MVSHPAVEPSSTTNAKKTRIPTLKLPEPADEVQGTSTGGRTRTLYCESLVMSHTAHGAPRTTY
jgi:hypothetical protein